MSIIGPRPALWNQGDLIKERDKYGANDVPVGLSPIASTYFMTRHVIASVGKYKRIFG